MTLPPQRSHFCLDEFLDDLAQTRGRRIHLLYQALGQSSVACGLWVATQAADYIVVDPQTPRTLRQHIVLHETAHMLLGHAGLPSAVEATFTTLDPDMVLRVLARTTYDTPEERAAEALATYLGMRYIAAQKPVDSSVPAPAPVLERFARAVTDGSWNG